MFREISSVFSFLTILPMPSTDLKIVARYMYLFPLVGIVLGLLVGSIGFGLSIFLDPLITSLIVVASLAIITGIHHTDGLSDFADGLMTRGSREKKRAAMKDLSTGSAGIVAIVLYLVGLIIAFSMSNEYDLFLAILFGEIMAKFSMVFMAGISRSISSSSSYPFVGIMKSRRKLFLASLMTLVPLVVLGGTTGLVIFGIGIVATMFLATISARSFGGITGDVLGTANELVRLTSVMAFVVI